MSETTTTTISVQGMTCGHCVTAVSNEVSKLDGVTSVAVDLETGNVAITSDGPLADSEVRAAIDEAGYEMTS